MRTKRKRYGHKWVNVAVARGLVAERLQEVEARPWPGNLERAELEVLVKGLDEVLAAGHGLIAPACYEALAEGLIDGREAIRRTDLVVNGWWG